MQKRKYYILYLNQKGIVNILSGPYSDITEIDLITLNATKKEWQESHPELEKAKDIFIARITYNKSKKNYAMKDYEVLFKCENKIAIYSKLEELLKTLALERLQKTKDENLSIRLNSQSIYQKELLQLITRILFSNLTYLNQFTSKLYSEEMKNYFWNYYKDSSNTLYQNKILKSMEDYKTVRYEILILLKILNHQPLEKKYRENYLYSSLIFDYIYDFPINIDEAGLEEKDFMPISIKEEQKKLNQILMSPFDSHEIQTLYDIGGVENVLNTMNTNDLYNSTKEDLLRLGLYSSTEYFEQERMKKRK